MQSQKQATDSASITGEKSTHLFEVAERTREDGTYRAPITDIHVGEDEITVTVDITSYSQEEFTFDIPKVWTDEYEFVELVQDLGYGAVNYKDIPDDNVSLRLEHIDGEFQRYNSVSTRGQISNKLKRIFDGSEEDSVWEILVSNARNTWKIETNFMAFGVIASLLAGFFLVSTPIPYLLLGGIVGGGASGLAVVFCIATLNYLFK